MQNVIRNNVAALRINNMMESQSTELTKTLKKISSGMKISEAKDDPSGYAISEKMRLQIRSMDQLAKNVQNGSALLRTAEGAVSSTVEILKTLKEKALAAANGTCTNAERAIIQKEFNQAIDQIDDNANVSFNGRTLVDGSMDKACANGQRAVYYNDSLSHMSYMDPLIACEDRNGNSLGITASDSIEVLYCVDGISYSYKTQVTANKTLLNVIGFSQIDYLDKTGNNIDAGMYPAPGKWPFDPSKLNDNKDLIGIDNEDNEVRSPGGSPVYSIGGSKHMGIVPLEYSYGGTSGFIFTVYDQNGNIKRDATRVLDDFKIGIKEKGISKQDNALSLQVGTKSNQTIQVPLGNLRPEALGLRGTRRREYDYSAATGIYTYKQDVITGNNINVLTTDSARMAVRVIDNALELALDEQTKIGAVQKRLEYTESNITTAHEDVTAAESTICDSNMATIKPPNGVGEKSRNMRY